jgi:hypothetical protein
MAVMEPSTAARAELDAIRIRRAELREALDGLERALAAPASGRAVVWGEVVHSAAGAIADDFGAHVEATEGPGGLHQTILAGDLRLANAVGALTAEHELIAAEIAELVAGSTAPVGADDVEAIRERGTALLGHLVRHRQRGADLIYEAYETDIGGGD